MDKPQKNDGCLLIIPYVAGGIFFYAIWGAVVKFGHFMLNSYFFEPNIATNFFNFHIPIIILVVMTFFWLSLFDKTGNQIETAIAFKSGKFPPTGFELEQIKNDEFLVGERLAEFVQSHLEAKELNVSEPVQEDWGWLIQIKRESVPDMFVGCLTFQTSEEDRSFGYVYVNPTKDKVFAGLRFRHVGEDVKEIYRYLLEKVVEDEEIEFLGTGKVDDIFAFAKD